MVPLSNTIWEKEPIFRGGSIFDPVLGDFPGLLE